MVNKIEYTPYALQTIEDAYTWYELQQTSLGDEFLSVLSECEDVISRLPTYFSFIDNEKLVRDFLMPRFPYLIVYSFANNKILVLSVHHTKKHPSKKYGK